MELKVGSVLLVAILSFAMCSADSEYREGKSHKLPNIGWEQWKPWSSCSSTCGPGSQTRERVCKLIINYKNTPICIGPSQQSRACDAGACPVDGMWSEWSDGGCSVTCGQGTLVRTRQCNSPAPSNRGKDCVGDSSETAVCDTGVDCPVDGMWSEWTDGPCSVTCGEGQLTRTRECSNPPPSNGGMDCVGDSSKTVSCDAGEDCPVDGMWSEWTDGPCSVTCGDGLIVRTRECNNPPPSNGGMDCVGDSSETATCGTGKDCHPDPQWSDWSEWSRCAKACRNRTQKRTRECNNPAPHPGSSDQCVGPSMQTRLCKKFHFIPCPHRKTPPIHGNRINKGHSHSDDHDH